MLNDPSIPYEIYILEPLDTLWKTWFDEMEMIHLAGNPGGTLLSGKLTDQAALFGILGRIRDLNLTLVAIIRPDMLEPEILLKTGNLR